MMPRAVAATVDGPLIGAAEPPSLHLMTWNIRRRMSHPAVRAHERWEVRLPVIRALLSAEQPTLLGLQEALPGQARDIRRSLGAQFRRIGHGRERGGRGEACPIIFDETRLELREYEQVALSRRPAVPGSRSWGAVFPRVCVSALFHDRCTGLPLLVINTHFDHLSALARFRSAEFVRRVVADRGLPSVVMGDLNASDRSRAVRTLLDGGDLADSWQVAAARASEEWGTLGRFRPPLRHGRRIDWIAVSPEIVVSRAAIDPRRHRGHWGSDHLPVHAEIRVAETGRAS